MRRSILLVSVVLLASCERGKTDAQLSNVARPKSVILDYARKSQASTDGLRAFAGAVNPLATAAIDEGALLARASHYFGLTGVSWIDRAAPAHMLLVERGGRPGVVLLVKVASADKLDAEKGSAVVKKQNGWAAVGKEPFVGEVAGYALTTLAAAPAPELPTAVIYMRNLIAAHEQDLKQMTAMIDASPNMQGQMRDFMHAYVDGLLSMARDTEEVRVTLDASAAQAELDVAFSPVAGSRLATFVAAQKTSDFALLGKLPADPSIMTVGGHLVLGPYHDAFVAVMSQFYKMPASDMQKPLETIIAATTGEFAMDARLDGGMRMAQLLELTDVAGANAAVDAIHTAFASGKKMDMGQVAYTYQAVAAPIEHDGVKLQAFTGTYDTKGADPAQLAMLQKMAPGMALNYGVGTIDKQFTFVMSPDIAADGARVIDAARGKAAHLDLGTAGTSLVALARTRGDSVVTLIDVARIKAMMMGGDAPAQPMMLSFGGSGGAAHMRFVVPTPAVRALMP